MNSTSMAIERNFFKGFYAWDAIKILHLSFQAILSLIAPVLLYLVVAYENSLNNRLLTNQLLSHFCSINLISFLTARIIFLIAFYFGPFSAFFCDITIKSRFQRTFLLKNCIINKYVIKMCCLKPFPD